MKKSIKIISLIIIMIIASISGISYASEQTYNLELAKIDDIRTYGDVERDLGVAAIMKLNSTNICNVSFNITRLQEGSNTIKAESDTYKYTAVIDVDYYDPTGTMEGTSTFVDKANIVIGIMRALGTIIAVVALMVIGFRYMFGSVSDKASYKEAMVPYIIGAIMLFTIPNIVGIIFDLVKGITF